MLAGPSRRGAPPGRRAAVAITNAIAFVSIAVWLFSDDRGIPSAGSFGSWVFDVFDVTLAVLAVLAGRAFYRDDV